jgi:hypothetical protein
MIHVETIHLPTQMVQPQEKVQSPLMKKDVRKQIVKNVKLNVILVTILTLVPNVQESE